MSLAVLSAGAALSAGTVGSSSRSTSSCGTVRLDAGRFATNGQTCRLAVTQSARGRGLLHICAAAKDTSTRHNGDELLDSVEMFVASQDDSGIFNRAKEMARRIVPKPRNGNAGPGSLPAAESSGKMPMETESFNTGLQKVNGQATAMANMAQKRARALQAELGIVSAELREKTKDLRQSEKVLRQKDTEISGLKGMLQRKEMQVVAARSELVDARVQIQEKDVALQTALEQLTCAAKERSKLRQDLIGAQTELMETRGEIERWTVHLNQLKAVMDSVDVDAIEEAAIQEMYMQGEPVDAMAADQMIDDEYFDMLMDLNELASSLAQEAAEDEKTFLQLGEQMGGQQ